MSVAEHTVVERVVEKGRRDDCEVENLVACPTEVESAGLATLRAPYHVNNCALDVDVATESIEPDGVWCDVILVEGKDDEHKSCGEAQNDVHNSTYLAVLGLVKLRDQRHDEAGSAGDAKESAVHVSHD